ncbi:MAG: glucosamine-6-phosphate deaminase, partial [Bacteroidetes bacterium SW_11_64_17]
MLVEVVDDYEALSDRAAEVLIEQIREQPDSTIGFAT